MTSRDIIDLIPENVRITCNQIFGYEDNGRGALAPQGVSRETQRFRMTAERWRSRPRSPIEIEGLDTCREMFGA